MCRQWVTVVSFSLLYSWLCKCCCFPVRDQPHRTHNSASVSLWLPRADAVRRWLLGWQTQTTAPHVSSAPAAQYSNNQRPSLAP